MVWIAGSQVVNRTLNCFDCSIDSIDRCMTAVLEFVSDDGKRQQLLSVLSD